MPAPSSRQAMLLAFVLLLGAAPSRAADYQLLPVGSAPIQTGIYDVRAADLDGDGYPEVVASIYDQGKVAVVRNDGAGHFAGATLYTLPGAQASTLRDFTGDGKADVLAVSYGGTISLFPNQGDGTLGAPSSYPAGTHPLDVVAGDFDGDGILDAAVATDDGEIVIRRGIGGGVFMSTPDVITAGGRLWGIDAADLDHDGRLDLVVVDEFAGQLREYRGLGGLNFQAIPAVTVGARPSDVRLADLDGDGWVDAAVSRLDGNAVVVHNVSGALQFSGAFAVDPDARSIDIADFDLDGVPDLLVSSDSQWRVRVLAGLGGMSFALATSEPTAGNNPKAAIAADFDQDGRPDVLAGNSVSGTVTYLRNAKDPRADCRTLDVDYGTAFTGKSQTIDVTLRNIGGQMLETTAALEGSDFVMLSPPGPYESVPGGGVLIAVRYTRATEGGRSGTLTFTTNDPLSPEVVVHLHGTASPAPVAAILAPSPATVAAGGQTTALLRLRNLGGGPLQVYVAGLFDLAESSGLDVGPSSAPFLRTDASGAVWDVAFDGSLGAGTQDAYMGGMKLAGFPVQGGGILGVGTRELRVGPSSASGLAITRKVYVSPGLGYVRFVDVAENPDSVAHTWSFDLTDNLGFAQVSPILTSSGDGTFTTADDWVVVPPDVASGSRAVGRVLRTAGALGHPSFAHYGQTTFPNSFTRSKYEIEVAPRSRAAIVQWAIQGTDASDAVSKAGALRLSPASAYEHIDAIDRFSAVNLDPAPAIFTYPNSTLNVPPHDSLDIQLGFDGELASHESQIVATLRLETDDPARPEFDLPLTLNVTGGSVVGSDPVTTLPGVALAGLVPNPARVSGSARIAYRLASDASASITLYDVRGRVLARRALDRPAPGAGTIELGRGGFAPGVVWLRLEQSGQVATTKGILLP